MGNSCSKKGKEIKVLETPWRSYGSKDVWSAEFRDELMTEIKDFQPYGELEYAKIQLLGQVNAGKSSVLNSVLSIDADHIAEAALTGAADSSYTLMLEQLIPKKKIGGQYRILDAMGLEDVENKGFHVKDVICLMEGKIKPTYKFKPSASISKDDPLFIPNPSMKDMPQCSAIIIDSNQINRGTLTDEGRKRLNQLQTYIRETNVAVVILLTKIDTICEEEEIDITEIYKSAKIKELVDSVSQIFGVPVKHIFPVQNYTKETILDNHIDILHLLALQKMLHITNDRLEYKDNQTK